MEIVAALQRLGFAEYEARAYVALVKRSPLNGYELAKASGIPRANVYGVLERLTARRAVVRLDEPGGTRYAPVPPAELMERLGTDFRQAADETSRALEALEPAAEHEPVVNVRGYPALLDMARAALRAARRSLLIAIWPHEALALRDEVAAAEQRDVAITTLCMAGCERECGGCRGAVYRYRAAADDAPRRLVVVPDGADLVAGEIRSDADAHSVRTRQPLMIDIANASVRSSIALAAIVADLGPRLGDALAPETRAALDAAAPAGDPSAFVERLRALKTD
jgi:HTH-type transcriptional regulator, sugar sensing transcriptional regulator